MTISLGRLSAFPCFSVINELIGNQNGVVGGYVTVFKDEVEGCKPGRLYLERNAPVRFSANRRE